ncbi:WD40-repeat-containing domain protein [Lineolata rhizophorae]|uniref:WD40-repeat-containing domain protein n=1 Tax=Lineolata rhizophorae TaxID=578093 RepID=A0A6A6NR70_9PEZI|nr:WD40-repeat-containing domain protein [Lineolata rhizophorae]
MPQSLRHESLLVPVTAVTTWGTKILAGEGPFLQVYDTATYPAKHLNAIRVFESQAIHGIRLRHEDDVDPEAVIWGGSCLCIVSLSTVGLTIECRKTANVQVNDWILDLCLMSGDKMNESRAMQDIIGVLVTAHNALFALCAHSNDSSRGFYDLAELSRGTRCILYSAHLQLLPEGRILVAAGTAFGEVLVWSLTFHLWDGQRAELHYIFSGHEGSIFGVQISEALEHTSTEVPWRKVLASCSDDRTIRLWDISGAVDRASSAEAKSLEQALAERESGFGIGWKDDVHKDGCLAMAWGHISRIWGVRFLRLGEDDEQGKFPYHLVSFGEDSTCQLWNIRPREGRDGDIESPLLLEHFGEASYHSGKNIWCIDVVGTGRHSMILTGAADGSVVSFSPDSHACGKASSCEMEISNMKVMPTAKEKASDPPAAERQNQNNYRQPREDPFRCYAFTSERTFVVTTKSGKVCRCDTGVHTSPSGKTSITLDVTDLHYSSNDLRGYSIAAGATNMGLAFLTGSTGVVHCYDSHTNTISDILDLEGKPAGLFVTQETSCVAPQSCVLVATRLGLPVAQQQLLQRAGESPCLRVNSAFLALPESFMVTSSVSIWRNPDFVTFLGGRNGAILFFASIAFPASQGISTYQQPVQPSQYIPHIHGREAVTDLKWLPVSTALSSDRQGWLVSVGRDGTCSVLQFTGLDKPPTLVHKLGLPFGPNVEGICIQKHGAQEHLMFFGFGGKRFVVYDDSLKQEYTNVECGGAHRNWAFISTGEGDETDGNCRGMFVWTKASKANVAYFPKFSHQIVKSGSHGRDIKAVAISPTRKPGSQNYLIATGAEDTTIRILEYELSGVLDVSGQFRCVQVIRKHTTGIQQLAWSNDGYYLFSSGGNEEFYIWRVHSVPLLGVGIVCEGVCPPKSEARDLRVTSFAVTEKSRLTNFADSEERTFLITLTYSDSIVVVWQYSTSSNSSWALLCSGSYGTACLLQAAYLPSSRTPPLLTAATDGYLALWYPPQESLVTELPRIQASAKWRVHQNAIQCLDCCPIVGSINLVICGGDDNALSLTLMRSESNPSASTLLIPDAHAAALTACTVTTLSRDEGSHHTRYSLVATTAGNDQRVNIWVVRVDLAIPGVEGITVLRLATRATSVADVSDMSQFTLSRGEKSIAKLIICGVGMDMWTLD